MKKVTVIVRDRDDEAAVARLRSIGVLHVEHQQEPRGQDIAALREDNGLLDRALVILEEVRARKKECAGPAKEVRDWASAARHIADLRKRYDQLLDYSYTLKSMVEAWRLWGDFDPESIRGLEAHGVYLRLFQMPAKEAQDLPSDAVVEELARRRGMVLCAVVSDQKIAMPLTPLDLPAMSLGKMRERIAADADAMQQIMGQLCAYVPYYDHLMRVREAVRVELSFHEAVRGMGQAGGLAYIRGYVPIDRVASLEEAGARERWGLLIEDPGPDDMVPTLVRRSRLVSAIEPVFRLLEVVPGYRELDISRYFLVFFCVFFGILIGDAGYGLIYAALTFALSRKLGKGKFDARLFYVLSFCAVVWGALTGTFFGQVWLAGIGVKPLVPALNDAKNMQAFCFFLGAFHLSLAHAWRAAIQAPALTALAEIGWVAVLWAAFFVARTLVLSDPFPSPAGWLIVGGLLLVMCFTSPQRNVLKALAAGLGTLALSVMNNFTDVVSYIRLFAVGLAGVAVSDAFNDMAGRIGFGDALSIAISLLIIVAGQLLGAVLGPISILVHGVRLNVLEFSGHAGVTWSGTAYKPLKKE